MGNENVKNLKSKIAKMRKKTDIEEKPSRGEKAPLETSEFHYTEDEIVPTRNNNKKRLLKSIPIDKVKPNPFQPRTLFEGIDELANSIEEKGLIQPITVLEVNGEYMLIAGERRLRACKIISEHNPKYKNIEAIIHDDDNITDEEKELLAALENHQRSDMTIIDTANMYASINKYASYSEMNKLLGDSRTAISRYIKIASLPNEIKAILNKKDIKSTNKIELLALLDGNIKKQTEIAQDILNDEPLIKIENMVKKILRGKDSNEKNNGDLALSCYEEVKPVSKVIPKSKYRKLDGEKRNQVDEMLNNIVLIQKDIQKLIES